MQSLFIIASLLIFLDYSHIFRSLDDKQEEEYRTGVHGTQIFSFCSAYFQNDYLLLFSQVDRLPLKNLLNNSKVLLIIASPLLFLQ